MLDELADQTQLWCTLCGGPLGVHPDDRPDWPTGPMCGDCYQAREMDNEIWMSEQSDDEDEFA